MLEPVTYEFPTETEVFARQAYTDRAKAINATSDAERSKIRRDSLIVGLVAFLSLFALLLAAHSGLTRAERAYQEASRV